MLEYKVRVFSYGSEWFLNGKKHRVDGPAIERISGFNSWWLNGKRHRTDGPAVEFPNGTKEWHLNGLRHREDGPAFVGTNGYKAWYLNGMNYTEEEYNTKTKMNPVKELSIGDISKLLGYEVKIIKG